MCADSLKFQVEPSATALTKGGRLDGLLVVAVQLQHRKEEFSVELVT
jgi:hypothetical protein